MSTFTAQTTAAIQTTVDKSSTPSTPVITTENATHTTMNRTRQGKHKAPFLSAVLSTTIHFLHNLLIMVILAVLLCR